MNGNNVKFLMDEVLFMYFVMDVGDLKSLWF